MPVDPKLAQLRGQLAIHRRWHPDDSEGIAERQAALDRANLRRFVKGLSLSHEEIAEIVEEEIMT